MNPKQKSKTPQQLLLEGLGEAKLRKCSGKLLDATAFSEEDQRRFWSTVQKGPHCWEWKKPSKKYGKFLKYIPSTQITANFQAHRVSFALSRGVIPAGINVCHTCDNPICVNPDHLFLGTQADNMKDKKEKGREHHLHLYGEACKHNKLTESQVRDILEDTRPCRMIAKSYGMGHSQIIRIKAGQSWQHITKPESINYEADVRFRP